MNSYGEDAMDMEFRIWSYLDGDCTEAEQRHILLLIQTNTEWQAKYAELSGLHQSLHTNLEIEEPAMRFTQNVMDAVATQKILKPVRGYVNQWIIRGIAAFFIVVIGYYFFGILDTINWKHSSSSPTVWSNWNMPKLITPSMLYGMLLFTIVAGLMLLDALLRRKSSHRNA